MVCLLVWAGFICAAHAADECLSIGDVFLSDNVNAYRVVDKTYFYKKCENDDNLCPTGQYVISGDYLLAGYRGEILCAAYIPQTHEIPRAIGWIEDKGHIKVTEEEEYKQISGDWLSNERPIYKTIMISPFENKKMGIYGDIFSRISPRKSYLEGEIFKINTNRYIVNRGECKDIISYKNDNELIYEESCLDLNSPLHFDGKYRRSHNENEGRCDSVDEIFLGRSIASYIVGEKTPFYKRCKGEGSEENGGICETGQYAAVGDYLLAASYGQKLCVALLPQTHKNPSVIGWIKPEKANRIADASHYAELMGKWQSTDGNTAKIMNMGIADIAPSEGGYYISGYVSISDRHDVPIEGYVYKIGVGRYVLLDEWACQFDLIVKDGLIEVKSGTACSYFDGFYHRVSAVENN